MSGMKKPRPKKCKTCKERFQPEKQLQEACSIKCAIDLVRIKQERKIRKDRAARRKEFNANDKKYQITKTRLYFNQMIREIDAGKPCISCGKPVCGSRMEAGHFKSVGSHPELRFDPRNVYLQGSGCNRADSGKVKNNLVVSRQYEERLRETVGDEIVDWLNGPHEPKKYTCEDLLRIQKICREEINYLKENGKPSRNWRSLDWEGW